MDKDYEDRKKHFQNALSNYLPVIGIIDEFDEKNGSDDSPERFPENWTDPLELYGQSLKELIVRNYALEEECDELEEFLDDHSPQYVWENRRRLVAERIFIHEF